MILIILKTKTDSCFLAFRRHSDCSLSVTVIEREAMSFASSLPGKPISLNRRSTEEIDHEEAIRLY